MSKKVSVSNLNKAIADYLDEYREDIEEDVVESSDKLIKEARAEVQAKSPKDTGAYAKGWTIATEKGTNYYKRRIHNKNRYQLTHLLEFGHATRSGSRVPAQPHITPVELKYKNKFIQELERKIKQ